MTFRAAKDNFFDRDKVIAATDKARRRNLSRFGAFVRTRARSSIRESREISAPGQPPHAHISVLSKPKRPGDKGRKRRGGLLGAYIFFAYDAAQGSVLIGPVRLSGVIGNAPEALEHGGTSLVSSDRGKHTRQVTIAARPFMRPALETELNKLPALWADSIK